MTETTNDLILMKTLVCFERQQHDFIPEKYQLHKKNCQAGSVWFSLKTKESSQRTSEQPISVYYTKYILLSTKSPSLEDISGGLK